MRYILTLLLFQSFLLTAFAQTCLPNGITFTTQQEIDDFPSNYPGCVEIGGSLIIEQSSDGFITNLDSLTSITSIGGNLVIGKYNKANPELVSLEGLGNLDSIGGYCSIVRNYKLSSLGGFENVNSIGSDVYIRNNWALTSLAGFTSLTSIDTLEIISNPGLTSLAGFEGAKTIKGILIHYNPVLTSFVGGFSNLDSLGELNIYGNNTLVDFNGFENLSQIGDLIISNNDGLTSIQGLGNNPSVTNSIGIWNNSNLTDLTALVNVTNLEGKLMVSDNSSLESLAGLENISSIGGLYLVNNYALKSISHFGNIGEIGGYLKISYNNALESLDGLENVSSIDGYIEINFNDALTSIEGIVNIDPASVIQQSNWVPAISLSYNKNLSSCAVESVCALLATPGKTYKIQNNASGCNSAEQIDCDKNYISGIVFYDENKNGKLDDGEFGVPNQRISMVSGGVTLLTKKDGTFRHYAEAGSSYEIAWKPNLYFNLVSDSTSYIISSFNSNSSNNTNKNFGIYPAIVQHKGIINIDSYKTRCNTEVKFTVGIRNVGAYEESGMVQISYDSTTTFISANFPIVDDTINHLLLVDYGTIAPFQSEKIILIFAMPSQNGLGEVVEFGAKLWSNSTGQEVLLDSDGYWSPVLCAFDPNDKRVMPPGVQAPHYTLHDEQLTYTIRFQNTGNAEAIDITILDTLDSDLDVNTLRVVNSSFPVQTTIDDQEIKFYFKNILLPDSLHNESESHGYVTYEINPIAGLEDNVEITNTAHIIFDSNDAIITNSTLNTMVTFIPVGISDLPLESVRIHPNPTSSIFYIDVTDGLFLQKVRLFDAQGRKVLVQNGRKVDVSKLPRGIYSVEVEFKTGIGWAKIVVE